MASENTSETKPGAEYNESMIKVLEGIEARPHAPRHVHRRHHAARAAPSGL